MSAALDLAAVKARCAEAICADCGGDGQFGLRQHACDSCGGHEDAAGRGIVDDATAVRVMTDDVPALVAEVERLSAENARLRAEVDSLRSALSDARAALDGERDATRSVRIDIADIVRVVAEMPRAKADESIVRWTERLQAVTISSARRAANEKEKSS